MSVSAHGIRTARMIIGRAGMQSKSLWWVGLFAIAMAYLESAVVVYLRRIYGISDLILSVPPFDPQIGAIELGRELATLVMLLTVGWVAGRKFQSRLGLAIFAFAVGVFFITFGPRVLSGWRKTFLIPVFLFCLHCLCWGPCLLPFLSAALCELCVGFACLKH